MTDFLLQTWMSLLIDWTRLKWMLGAGRPWKPGEPLKLLFAGYTGSRNTGSDMRVHEMLRQVNEVLGKDRVRLTVTVFSPDRARGYFGDATQLRLPDAFPPFLYSQARQHDGVIACEGSMFKSKFANALTTMTIGALGLASAENKLSVGYGGDADKMDSGVANMCRQYCRESLIITRNEESQAILSELGIPAEVGTDTAWTFQPLGPEYGRKVLRDAGWNGSAPVMMLCPINPFFWPVKASLPKLVANRLSGAYKSSHYRGPYFHTAGPEVDRKYAGYLDAYGNAAKAFGQRHNVFTVLGASERLDAQACHAIAERLGGAPVFTSDDHDMFQFVSIVRSSNLLISSRYHAIVGSMPALVPSAGVTMDERIRNLMRERGHMQLLMNVNDDDLEERILAAMETLYREGESVRDGIGSTVARNLRVMARMGVYLERQVSECYPHFPVRSGVHGWEEYLPPLAPELVALMEQFDTENVGADRQAARA